MVCLCHLRSLKVPALQHSRRIRTGPTSQYMWTSGLLAKLRSNMVLKYSYLSNPAWNPKMLTLIIWRLRLYLLFELLGAHSYNMFMHFLSCSCIFHSVLRHCYSSSFHRPQIRRFGVWISKHNSYNRCIDSELWLRNNHHPVLVIVATTLAKPHAWLVPEHIILVQMCGNIPGTFCVWPT